MPYIINKLENVRRISCSEGNEVMLMFTLIFWFTLQCVLGVSTGKSLQFNEKKKKKKTTSETLAPENRSKLRQTSSQALQHTNSTNLGHSTASCHISYPKKRSLEYQFHKLIASKFMIQYVGRALTTVFGLQKTSVSGIKYYY